MKKYYATTFHDARRSHGDSELYIAIDADAALAARDREIAELRADAERWRALRNCARITAMGSAGCHPDGQDFATPYAHVTLNFWTHSAGPEHERYHREWLDVFVSKAVFAMKEQP